MELTGKFNFDVKKKETKNFEKEKHNLDLLSL